MELRLREWRTERGLSLRRLAEMAGVSFVTLYRIEAGKISPTVALLERIAGPLRITLRDFFPEEAKPRRARRNHP